MKKGLGIFFSTKLSTVAFFPVKFPQIYYARRAPIHLSGEEGAVHTDHEALMGGLYFADFWEPTGELRLTAQASGLLDIYII
jgi:hypothetical protein